MFTGGPVVVLLTTTTVAVDDADAEPSAFAAVTDERIVWVTSVAASVYVLEVAPLMLVQLLPEVSQSCHW
jgi:hypothetical protein